MTQSQRRNLIVALLAAALCAAAVWYGIHAADPYRRRYDGPAVDSPTRRGR